MSKPRAKLYLGDGVYAEMSADGYLALTTENGVSVTNTIYLEPEVIESLYDYIDMARQP